MGTRQRMAISLRVQHLGDGRRPPRPRLSRVASLAMTTTSRSHTVPKPVTTPTPGACPSYWSYATRNSTCWRVQQQGDALAGGQACRRRAASECGWARSLPQPRLQLAELLRKGGGPPLRGRRVGLGVAVLTRPS